MITRPVMRYPGGKYKLATWVISHFPTHETYVELFGGAASVLLRKPRSIGEVFNDLDGDVMNVFRVLRDPDQAKQLELLLSLTPYAHDEYDAAYEDSDDPIERARRMIFRSYAGHGSDSVMRAHSGFRGFKSYDSGVTTANEWMHFSKEIPIFTERLQGVCIENCDALRLITHYDRPATLFYADPPYIKSSRTSNSVRYKHEYTDDDHIRLAEALHNIQGMAIVSGYSSGEYDQLYAGWSCTRHHAKLSKECLWLSPNIKTVMF